LEVLRCFCTGNKSTFDCNHAEDNTSLAEVVLGGDKQKFVLGTMTCEGLTTASDLNNNMPLGLREGVHLTGTVMQRLLNEDAKIMQKGNESKLASRGEGASFGGPSTRVEGQPAA